ncbi:MAG TPA: hypothetical protein VNH19_10380, partial [Candidatus Limnocylindrales bacterium]|nr:hypothetical protein [Candidatus Limnocylindrales bacterium]
ADTYLSLSAPAQAALPALLAQRHSLRRQLLARIHENLSHPQSQLCSHPDCELLHAEAGWYATLRYSTNSSIFTPDEALAIHLLRHHHVLLHPGHFYDFPSSNYLVLSLITPTSAFRQAVLKLLSSP